MDEFLEKLLGGSWRKYDLGQDAELMYQDSPYPSEPLDVLSLMFDKFELDKPYLSARVQCLEHSDSERGECLDSILIRVYAKSFHKTSNVTKIVTVFLDGVYDPFESDPSIEDIANQMKDVYFKKTGMKFDEEYLVELIYKALDLAFENYR
ncbi:hypothetical protein CMO88_04265 [Candidatus Woesearchaeota archaeon]|nr:hypothetical protein [Candidatus Woesearchaeota archaeon]|tara:strand:- start:3831 stop:4283 length:453 start_codon:yes stop_codon:yes gene_type:complete